MSYQEKIRCHTKRTLISYEYIFVIPIDNKTLLEIGNKFKTCFLCILCKFVKTIKNCHKFVPQISAVSALCGVEPRGFVPLKPPLIQFTISSIQYPNIPVLLCASPPHRVPLCVCAIKSQCTQCKSEVPVCVCH